MDLERISGLHAGGRRKESTGQFYECIHLAGHPFILMIDNLAPGLHVEILHIKGRQAAGFNVGEDGKPGKEGDAHIGPQQVDDEFRIPDFEERADGHVLGCQVLLQYETVACIFLSQDEGLSNDLGQVQVLPAGKWVLYGGYEYNVLRLFQDLDPFVVIQGEKRLKE